MVRSILSAPGWLVFVGLVVAFPAVVLLVQTGIRRRWPALARGEHNDVVGFIIAVVGVIYAVLLAFVVIVAWESFTRAETVVGQEASALRTLYRDSVGLPGETREEMQDLVLQYATEVVDDSWPAMAEGIPGDPEAGDVLQEMAEVLAGTPVTEPTQQEFVAAEVDRLNQLVSLRSQRLDFVEIGIPGVLWLALIVGGVVTIGFALLFVALMVNYPFTGDVAVQPDSFLRVLDDFGEPLPAGADGD